MTNALAFVAFPFFVYLIALMIDVAIGGAALSGWEVITALIATAIGYWAFFTGRLANVFRKV